MHLIKPLYVLPLLLLQPLSYAVSGEITKIRTGVLLEVEPNSLQFSAPGNMTLSIGFTCQPSVCNRALKFSAGDNVIAAFGSENGKNKLISIRGCLETDPECERVGKEMEAEEKHRTALSEEWSRQQERCNNEMQVSLSSDERYVQNTNFSLSIEDREQIVSRYNSLLSDEETKLCIEKIVSDHQNAVLESCKVHRCGEDIGGGCYHIAGYSIASDVLSRAISKCST